MQMNIGLDGSLSPGSSSLDGGSGASDAAHGTTTSQTVHVTGVPAGRSFGRCMSTSQPIRTSTRTSTSTHKHMSPGFSERHVAALHRL
jgi:hypothetical protein